MCGGMKFDELSEGVMTSEFIKGIVSQDFRRLKMILMDMGMGPWYSAGSTYFFKLMFSCSILSSMF